MPLEGSTVVRRQLGRRLRALREGARKTVADVVEAGIASKQTLWRIEKGTSRASQGDVLALCRLYGVDQATTDALVVLQAGTAAQGWWEDYSSAVPSWFGLYVGLEAAAEHLRTYDPDLLHGLLQTPAYMRALFTESGRPVDEDTVERQIKLRLERQQTLTRREPPLRLTAIVGAGALARRVGGDPVMAEQVAHLREVSELDHVDIRVLTFEAGGHAAIGPFTLLDFVDPDDPAVAYLETHTGARYLEKPDELAEYRKVFDLIYQKTVPIEEYQP